MSEDARPARVDALREKVRAGLPVFGGWLTGSSPELLAALTASDLDYVGIDCQHGSTSEGEIVGLVGMVGDTARPCLVRVSSDRPELIGLAVDGGADGVIIPTVDSAEEASAAVAAIRFPPDGIRSYGPMAPRLPRDPASLQSRVLVLPMVETRAGLDAVEEILAVEGVDGVYVGPADLGLSLGLGHMQFPPVPELEPALEKIAEAAGRTGKCAGVHAGHEAFANRYVELGYRLLTLGIAESYVGIGVRSALARIAPREGGGTEHGGGLPY